MILDIVGLQISVPEFILTIISFFLFMFLLNKFLFKPVLSFMDARKARIDEGLAEGKKAEAALEENKAQLAQELAQTGADARGVINAARSDAEKAKGEVLNAAHAEAEQLHKNVRERVKTEEKAAVGEIDGLSLCCPTVLSAAQRITRRSSTIVSAKPRNDPDV